MAKTEQLDGHIVSMRKKMEFETKLLPNNVTEVAVVQVLAHSDKMYPLLNVKGITQSKVTESPRPDCSQVQ